MIAKLLLLVTILFLEDFTLLFTRLKKDVVVGIRYLWPGFTFFLIRFTQGNFQVHLAELSWNFVCDLRFARNPKNWWFIAGKLPKLGTTSSTRSIDWHPFPKIWAIQYPDNPATNPTMWCSLTFWYDVIQTIEKGGGEVFNVNLLVGRMANWQQFIEFCCLSWTFYTDWAYDFTNQFLNPYLLRSKFLETRDFPNRLCDKRNCKYIVR